MQDNHVVIGCSVYLHESMKKYVKFMVKLHADLTNAKLLLKMII